jgi:serine/threonine-protein kinase
MAVAALHEGEVFAGRYRIVRELASGGMGAVYEVIHTVTERRCALKVMLSHTVEREQLRKRFMQESRLAAQIGSEYIVDVLDAGVDDETKAPYLVMELLEGEDLGQRLVRQGPLSREQGVSYLWHVALALDRTHQAGIVHRDLKASNLFLTRREDGTPLVKVLDFGVAKVLTFENSAEQRTQTVGTPIYMAPEQFRADGRISPATDIYALGMLAYTLLVGVHYWTEEHERCENPFAFASIAVHGPKEPPVARAAREHVVLPPAFDTWFARATNRWPQERFGSATAAVVALAEALEVEVPVVPLALPPPPPGSGEKPLPFENLPATLESPSGRLTHSGARTGGTPAPVVRHDSTGSSSREQHTEYSLSVTSGGLSPPLPPEATTKARGKTGAIVLSLALAGAVAAVGISRWRASHDAPKTATPVPAAVASVSPAVPPASAVAKEPAPPASANEDKEVHSIDELPIAAPDAPLRAAPAAEPPTLHRLPPAAPARRSRTSAATGSRRTPAPESQPERSAPTPATNRDVLYGRD